MTIPMKTTAQSQAGVVLMFSLIMMVIRHLPWAVFRRMDI